MKPLTHWGSLSFTLPLVILLEPGDAIVLGRMKLGDVLHVSVMMGLRKTMLSSEDERCGEKLAYVSVGAHRLGAADDSK